jgi:hypothetical protein
MTEESGSNRVDPGWGVAAVCGCVLALVFGPLSAALVERACFGTNHVEEACRYLGVHGVLSKIYETLRLTP